MMNMVICCIWYRDQYNVVNIINMITMMNMNSIIL